MLNENDINARLTPNDALFDNIYIIQQKFNIVPDKDSHYGASIDYQDISELRNEFLTELYNSIVDWVYSSDKYKELRESAMKMGRSEAAAHAKVQRKAREKFRGNLDFWTFCPEVGIGEASLLAPSRRVIIYI